MANGIYIEIKKRILDAEEGSIFVTSDFTDIATTTTVRKCLGRQVEEKNIRRIIDGVYEKPVYSNLLREYVPANPEKVAYAIARGFHWTIAPCGDVALNKLGLSTQVPVVWSYISDGPYRKFSWDNITLSFKHRANREISYMSETTTLVVEALKTLVNFGNLALSISFCRTFSSCCIKFLKLSSYYNPCTSSCNFSRNSRISSNSGIFPYIIFLIA